jgi:hypothetical protein
VIGIIGLAYPRWVGALRFRSLAVSLLALFVLSVAINAGPLLVAVNDTQTSYAW